MIGLTEDSLVQQTSAEYMRNQLGWDTVYAYNEETFGPEGTLGRKDDREVVLTRYLGEALVKLNPGIPQKAYQEAIRNIVDYSVTQSTLQVNREKYALLKNGVMVQFRNERGELIKHRLSVFDFENPEENHFLAVRELWVHGFLYHRRADIVGFVNGIPLLFIELKNIHKDIRTAYEKNLSDYKDTIPHLFHHNAFIILSNGDKGKIGSISSRYEHFHEWKRLAEEEPGVVEMETLLKGMCSKKNLMDLFENFILFDECTGTLAKIIARNHQFLGVNRSIEAVKTRQERQGKLGVFWHTQGAGKSYSMVFFSQKVHRKLPGDFTFLIVTDREDLDTQIYKTFAGCGIVDNDRDPCRAASGLDLKSLLERDKPYISTMIHKFHLDVGPDDPYSPRDDIIVISDEAHRTQYGRLALNMRNALPNAHYIGFTGTPLFKDDEITRRIFGNYVSTYDFQRAVDDEATVPLYYDNRGEKLQITTTDINEKIAAKLEELEFDPDQQARLEKELGRDYHIITAEKRLNAIAQDFVNHYTARWETGKAMLICIDKITTVRMYSLIQDYWRVCIQDVTKAIEHSEDEQEEMQLRRKLAWLKGTEIAVVISEEQGEVKRFQEWELDIIPHRKKIKNGYETDDGKSLDIDLAFKNPDHPFRIAIVCAMWLTGFDVPSLSSLYLDKPLKAHTLMQAIARANRVYEDKNNGLIVDYCGILKNLRKALATFASTTATGTGGEEIFTDPVKPEEELIEDLAGTIDMMTSFLKERGFDLEDVIVGTGFDKIAAINRAIEVINQSEETRKRFEILAREIFKKFKACLTIRKVNEYRALHNAVDIIYKKLQENREKADITGIIREMHQIVDEAIEPDIAAIPDDKDKTYDISKIDFDRLKEEFSKYSKKNTTMQNLKYQVEKRLQQMIEKNPLRTDFYSRYQEIIEDYNREKDRITIEETFAALLKFVEELDNEEKRAIQEGLDEETLALFDLLLKSDITPRDRNKLKTLAKELLATLKKEKLRVHNWREKEATKAEVKTFIRDFLWNEQTGLPIDAFTEEEVDLKADIVFDHIFKQYADAYHHAYAA